MTKIFTFLCIGCLFMGGCTGNNTMFKNESETSEQQKAKDISVYSKDEASSLVEEAESIEPPESVTPPPTSESKMENSPEQAELGRPAPGIEGFRVWLEALKEEKKVTDISSWNSEIHAFKYSIENTINDANYGGVDDLYREYHGTGDYQDMRHEIGVRIYTLDEAVARSAVEQCLENYDASVGQIEIEYTPARFSMKTLRRVLHNLEAQKFDQYDAILFAIANNRVIVSDSRGLTYGRPDQHDLEEFAKTDPDGDCIKITKVTEPQPNA